MMESISLLKILMKIARAVNTNQKCAIYHILKKIKDSEVRIGLLKITDYLNFNYQIMP